MNGSIIEKSIYINAPKERVWNIMLSDDTYKTWTAPFSEGSAVETDWKEGSKVIFKDGNNFGLVGIITKSRPYDIFEVEYTAELRDGVEDTTSKDAQSMVGGSEKYIFEEKGDGTHVSIESFMTEEYFEKMSLAWDKALQIVKDLAEKNT